MQQSTEVRDAMLRFYDRLSASDIESFDELVSQEPATLIIGTAPGEWVTERDRMRYGYEVGSMGWFVGEPTFVFPDGSAMDTRMTAVMHHEDGRWKLMHVSVGVADGEVVELRQRWSG